MNSEKLVFRRCFGPADREISVRLRDRVLDRIKDAVDRSGRSRDKLINELLRFAVEKTELK